MHICLCASLCVYVYAYAYVYVYVYAHEYVCMCRCRCMCTCMCMCMCICTCMCMCRCRCMCMCLRVSVWQTDEVCILAVLTQVYVSTVQSFHMNSSIAQHCHICHRNVLGYAWKRSTWLKTHVELYCDFMKLTSKDRTAKQLGVVVAWRRKWTVARNIITCLVRERHVNKYWRINYWMWPTHPKGPQSWSKIATFQSNTRIYEPTTSNMYEHQTSLRSTNRSECHIGSSGYPEASNKTTSKIHG